MSTNDPTDDRHPALIALENAPLDDMPETEEERAANARGRADIAAGRTFPGDVVSKALRQGRLADLLKGSHEQPRSEFVRKFLRSLDETATPGERALIEGMGRLDRELGEPPSDE